jgi:hypothetical protein
MDRSFARMSLQNSFRRFDRSWEAMYLSCYIEVFMGIKECKQEQYNSSYR